MATTKTYRKWDILLVDLNPTKGSEIAKVRPYLVISPNAINNALNTIIVVPLTSAFRAYPTRLHTNFKGQEGYLCFDQLKTIDKLRIIKKAGELEEGQRVSVNRLLRELFSE